MNRLQAFLMPGPGLAWHQTQLLSQRAKFPLRSRPAATQRRRRKPPTAAAENTVGTDPADLAELESETRNPDQPYLLPSESHRVVRLRRPLGVELDTSLDGQVYVDSVVEGGNAESAEDGAVLPGDIVVAVSVAYGTALIPVTDIDSVSNAVHSRHEREEFFYVMLVQANGGLDGIRERDSERAEKIVLWDNVKESRKLMQAIHIPDFIIPTPEDYEEDEARMKRGAVAARSGAAAYDLTKLDDQESAEYLSYVDPDLEILLEKRLRDGYELNVDPVPAPPSSYSMISELD
jgi:hypothetical protein